MVLVERAEPKTSASDAGVSGPLALDSGKACGLVHESRPMPDRGAGGEADSELMRKDAAAHAGAAGNVGAEPAGPAGNRPPSMRAGADPVVEAYKRHVDRTLLRQNLRRSATERVENLIALQRLAVEARRAGRARERDG